MFRQQNSLLKSDPNDVIDHRRLAGSPPQTDSDAVWKVGARKRQRRARPWKPSNPFSDKAHETLVIQPHDSYDRVELSGCGLSLFINTVQYPWMHRCALQNILFLKSPSYSTWLSRAPCPKRWITRRESHVQASFSCLTLPSIERKEKLPFFSMNNTPNDNEIIKANKINPQTMNRGKSKRMTHSRHLVCHTQKGYQHPQGHRINLEN